MNRLHCYQCGHSWNVKKISNPKKCPKCYSTAWRDRTPVAYTQTPIEIINVTNLPESVTRRPFNYTRNPNYKKAKRTGLTEKLHQLNEGKALKFKKPKFPDIATMTYRINSASQTVGIRVYVRSDNDYIYVIYRGKR